MECRRWSAAGARAPRLSVSDFIQRARQVPAKGLFLSAYDCVNAPDELGTPLAPELAIGFDIGERGEAFDLVVFEGTGVRTRAAEPCAKPLPYEGDCTLDCLGRL